MRSVQVRSFVRSVKIHSVVGAVARPGGSAAELLYGGRDSSRGEPEGEKERSQKQINKALPLAHAQTIHYTSN